MAYTYNADVIDNAIDSLRMDSDKLQNKVHNLLISALFIYAKAGHTRAAEAAQECAQRITRIQDNSPWHGKSVAVWVDQLELFEWSDENSVWFAPKADDMRLMTDRFKSIRDGKPFWETKPPSKATPYNNLDDLVKWVEKSTKRAQKPKDGDVIDLALVRRVRDAMKAA